MSQDGAHLGMSADSAMKAVLGDDETNQQENAKPRRTPEEMAGWIRSATVEEAVDYDGMARYTAKLVLDWLEDDPARIQAPVENVYQEDSQGNLVYRKDSTGRDVGLTLVTAGWYERMTDDGVPLEPGLSGFMWGWACNAARAVLELPPVPNPAIVGG